MKNLILILVLLSQAILSHAQTEPPSDSLGYDTIYYQSPLRIPIEAEAVVRFANSADVYLRWSAMPAVSNYTVRYKFGETTNNWITVQRTSNELLIENVPLDIKVLWDVIVAGNTAEPLYQSGVGLVSTAAQKEPIEVSANFYNKLEYWFSRDENAQGFCEFFNALVVNRYEKLSFLQAYSFDNARFVKPTNPSSANLNAWYPPNTTTGTGTGDWCIPITGNCNCKVITKGSNIAVPNEKLENFKVFPKNFKSTQRHRLEAGAAKFTSLFQDRTGGQTLEMSNAQSTGDNSSVTTQASEIVFFLACLTANGGLTTNLPTGCQCERPLHIYYEYSTRFHVRSNLDGCCGSRGAEATAEDLAFIGVYQGKTGDITALAAGQRGLSNSCSSVWNAQFWINLVNLATPIGEYYLQTLGNSDAKPTQAQLTAFINALKVLIVTNFTNKSGECGTLEQDQVLITGSKTFNLKPNSPIRVGLFSSYYLRTRGYGNWKAEAGVASDYHLLGVVESQLTEEPECCSDKYANYLAGSQSSPAGSRYSLHAPNTVENRINRVGFFLSTFGSWDGFNPIPGSGIINLLEHQFDNNLTGPSCINENAGLGGGAGNGSNE